MYDKFLSLSSEKQNKIINAALKVFSKTTYKKASTDEIVALADISKGALFHYFKNKKNLYFYLYDYIIDVLLKEYYERVNMEERDIFERFKNVVSVKLELLYRYPDIFDFAMNALREEEPEISDKIKAKTDNTTYKNFGLILKNIDKTKFREDIDPDIAIDMIMMTFEGYGNRELMRLRMSGFSKELYDRWCIDFEEYIKIMKNIYYKGV